ncbi:ribonuclease III [Desulfuromonas sp. AOP6]|uniref:ribonuclease III n=1 Tax=Desulfuromonas sp. AOP6 TaxID=1566351 RepID=UPI00128912DB|nr:ribonuclease III [Desulfuromonas sp. AOP6]BCA80027.1 ribonuclease 3 [Desulfuromonas sp. AOP6]
MQLRECEVALCQKLDHHFVRTDLLREALTHKSYSNEQDSNDMPFSERLEFLGDAVLDLAVSEHIFTRYSQLPEGEMTRVRAEVVREKGLATIARKLDIGACLLLGRGEERSGGRQKDSLLADAFEALLGAIFTDAGYAAVTPIVGQLFSEDIAKSVKCKFGVDHKTRLQVLLQGRHNRTPSYFMVSAEGPDHERLYTVEVRFDDQAIGQGSGRTKKAAEQEAARKALLEMESP